MFLVTVTPAGDTHPDLGRPAHIASAAPFAIRVYTDGFLSSCRDDADGFELVESPLTGCGDSGTARSLTVQYEAATRTLRLAKTLLGGRPLYYHLGPGGEFYCSTHIDMLAAAGVRLEENRDVLPEYFVYRVVMPPQTLFRGILDLPPGSRFEVAVGRAGCRASAVLGYDPPPARCDLPAAEAAARTLTLLRGGMEPLAAARDRTAILLSGGIDSSLLHEEARRTFGPIPSWSTEYPFDDPALSRERTYALSAAAALEARHTHFEMSVPRYLRGLIEATAAAEIPVHHLQSVCLHALFADGLPRARDVVLVGVGAGGSYGNFRNFLYWKERLHFRLARRQPMRGLARLASRLTGRGRGFVATLDQAARSGAFASTADPLWDWHAYGDPAWVCEFFGVTAREVIRWPLRALERVAGRPVEDVWALYSLLGDEAITQYVWSKIGEANGKRIYFPFYDDDTLRFLFSLSWRTKLAAPENALRREMARQAGVPAFIRDRPKSGFGVAGRNWAERGGVFEPFVPLVAKVTGEEPLRRLQSADGKRPMLFWNLLNYGLWRRLCIDREDPRDLLDELDLPLDAAGGRRREAWPRARAVAS